jgi:hypothetical protein
VIVRHVQSNNQNRRNFFFLVSCLLIVTCDCSELEVYEKENNIFIYLMRFFLNLPLLPQVTRKPLILVSERRIGIIEPIQSDEGNSSFGFVCFFFPSCIRAYLFNS